MVKGYQAHKKYLHVPFTPQPHTRHTVHVYTKAALAAAFWSWPLLFLMSACFLAFFCWDWNFWCPRAISDVRPEEIIQEFHQHNTTKKVRGHKLKKTIKPNLHTMTSEKGWKEKMLISQELRDTQIGNIKQMHTSRLHMKQPR